MLVALLGAALLLLLAFDVLLTVFHPEGHGGPLMRRLTGAVWRLWRSAAPTGKGRDAWLGFGGPLLAMLAPAVWALLLVLGYALIYYPWIDHFLVSPGSLRAHWAEALYHSGVVAVTLGTGDIVPDLLALRLLTIVEAFSGFALLSSALSYMLAVYRENGTKVTLASDLALHRVEGASDPDDQLGEERDRWLAQVARELVHVTQSHSQYPILHYFRPADHRSSLALQLAPLVRLAQSLEGGGPDPGGPTGGQVMVARALERYLAAADRRFVRSSPDADGGDGSDSMERRYLRLLQYLGYTPDATREDET